MKKFLFAALALVLLSSCSVQMKSSRSLALDPQAVTSFQAYDLEVSPSLVSGNTDGMTYSTHLTGTRFQCESFAIANALEKVGADVLVEPRFTYTYNAFGRLTRVSVTGYPAKYTNFRKAERQDIDPLYPEMVSVSDVKPVVVLPSKIRR